jgi:hypothetical protein
MADNIQGRDFDGNPVPLATDDIAGVHYPRSKIGFGADDAYADVSGVNPLPIEAATLPLPTGAATETTLAALNTKTAAALVDMPSQDDPALPVRVSPQKYTDISFSQVGSGLVSPELVQIAAGAGMTVSQSAGNLVIASGTTANAEFVARSVSTFNGAVTFKAVTTLSQRIVNNNFFVELVDVIGDGLAYSIVNAGAPGRYNASDANNGGAPGTVADKVGGSVLGFR